MCILLFLIIAYVWPILNLLTRSVDNRLISELLPETATALSSWEGNELPSEDIYKTFYLDLNEAHKQKLSGKVSTRLNYAKNGFKSLINKTRRKLKNFEDENYKEQFIDINKKWGDIEYWQAMKVVMPKYTIDKYLGSVDLEKILMEKLYRNLKKKNSSYFMVENIICSSWCYYLLFTISLPNCTFIVHNTFRYSNLLLICVLLPFWTSLLVRTSSWMILLQQQGVLNDFLVYLNIVQDDARLELMYNMTGTFVAMTQILLPFMVLPLYSVMKTIPPSLMRAGSSLGERLFMPLEKYIFL